MSVVVKFVFANSNVSVDGKLGKTATGHDAKMMLQSIWPKSVAPCRDLSRIRIICLGRVIQDDEEVIGNRSLKTASDPLPVNVSIKPSPEEIQKITSNKNINDVSGAGKTDLGGGGESSGNGGGGGNKSNSTRGANSGSRSRGMQSTAGRNPTPNHNEVCQCAVS